MKGQGTGMLEPHVVIVGGGGCGIVAGLRAARNPALNVLVLDKSTDGQNNTALSSGSLAAAGTSYQAAVGVSDSLAQQVDDIITMSRDEQSRPLVEAVCAVAPAYIDWLVESVGHPVELGAEMSRSGQSAPRLHSDPQRVGGQLLMKNLHAAAKRQPNLTYRGNVPVLDLITDGGRVTGVLADVDGAPTTIGALAVVLACGGFGASAEMIDEYAPATAGATNLGVSENIGDWIRWVRGLGAGMRNMGSYLGHGMVVEGHTTRLNPALPLLGAFIVNTKGERFCDETAQNYSGLGELLGDQPETRAAVIWDSAANESAAHSEMMHGSEKTGAIVTAGTVRGVGEKLGLPFDQLESTLAEIEQDPARGRKTPIGLTGPFYGAWATRGVLTTQGGVVVDTTGRVLNEHGSPIEGLYAGGDVAVGLSGPAASGYSPGNGLLVAFGLGWNIDNHLAETL